MFNNLIFVPYQDTDNFFRDGILTREFAMLYLLKNMGFRNIINVKKPRTVLDSPRYQIHDEYYPEGTIESQVKNYCDQAITIQHHPTLSVHQITARRGWWEKGYLKTFETLEKYTAEGQNLVYSDNPFASELLSKLCTENTAIYFDVMDNFAIHPSLSEKEHELALVGYKRIMNFADIVCANSKQTCEFIKEKTGREILLVKNGVFENNEASITEDISCVEVIRNKKRKYKKCVGYIGKLGLRLDADLIEEITEECQQVLFVFVGGYLKGQINDKLLELFETRENILHIDAVPSAFVYAILDEFDILSIPHAVGKAENGGDPLKLYQYLTRGKPIITTNILGVSEFSDVITISNSKNEWIEFINRNTYDSVIKTGGFYWDERFNPIRTGIEKCNKFHL